MLTDQEQRATAQDEVEYFSRKFNEWYGTDHMILAYHAAFPVALSVDMLYQIWANFKTYTDAFGRTRTIPMLAVSDLLLSNLLRPTAKDVYEMLPDTRAVLLDKLKNDPRFGNQRMEELASFLIQYIQQLPDNPYSKNFKHSQKLMAYMAVDPLTAAQQTLQELIDQVAGDRMTDSLGLTNLIETFARGNEKFTSILADHLQQADGSNDIEKNDAMAAGTLVLTSGGNGSITLNLSPHISNRLQKITEIDIDVPAPVPPEKIETRAFGLFIGISKYKLKSIRLPSSGKDAIKLVDCFQKYNLLHEQNIRLLTDKEANSKNILAQMDEVLSVAGPSDIVVIYFSGHMGQIDGSPMLVTYDYDDKKEFLAITDSEFNRRINKYRSNDPYIIFIVDSHGGNDKWLDKTNPKHIGLFGSRPGQMAFESPEGAIFARAFIDAIERYQGALTYRDLYRQVYENILMQKAGVNQLPYFILDRSLVDFYIFSLKRVNEVELIRSQLNECGYTSSENSSVVADTKAMSESFLSDHSISNDQKLRHYLSLKVAIQRKNIIKVLLVSGKTDSRLTDIFKGEDLELSVHRLKLTAKKAKAKTREIVEFDKDEEELDKKILDADVILMGYRSKDFNLYAPQIEKTFDVAFWLDKELVLFSEDESGASHLNQEAYSSILWGNLFNTDDNPKKVYNDLAAFRKFLEQLLHINQKPQEQQAPYSKMMQEAYKTCKLNLANQKLDVIPPEVFNINNLESLYLEGNNISTIPPAISKLKALKTLNLNGNPLKSLPTEILQLQQLQMLSLDNTDIEELSPDIDKLVRLVELRLHGTPLVIVPYSLANLKNLKVLDARETGILNVPHNILNHKNAPQRFRTFVKKHLPATEIKKDALLILEDGKETKRLVRLMTEKALGEDTIGVLWMKPELPTLYFVLHQIDHSGLIYVCDNEGKLFSEFMTMAPEKRQHVLSQFFGTHSAKRLHLFYDGSPMGDEFGNDVVKLDGLNSFITCKTRTNQIPNEFVFSFFDALVKRNMLSGSFTQAEEKSKSGAFRERIAYSLYKSQWFRDFFLSFTEKTGNGDLGLPGEIEEIIKTAKTTRSLNLRDRGLDKIPTEVFNARQIETLNISANHISELPETISRLTNLQTLDISRTQISLLPDGLFRLKNLRKLIMDNSEIVYIPSAIQQFKYLNTLNAQKTGIKVFPIELTKMPSLKHIDISGNDFINLPAATAKSKISTNFKKFFGTVQNKHREPVILQISSSGGSFVDIVREHQRSSEPVGAFYFQAVKKNVTSLLDVFKFIKDNVNDRSVLMIDDQGGHLASQFGNGPSRSHNIKQFFSSFLYPLNIINHGLLDEDSIADLVSDGTVNSIITRKNGKTGMNMSEILYDVMARAGISYYEAFDFFDKYFLSEKAKNTGVTSQFGYEIYQSKEPTENFYWLNAKALRNAPPLIEVIKKSKSFPYSIASAIVDRMLNERASTQRMPGPAPSVATPRAGSAVTSTPASSRPNAAPRAASRPKPVERPSAPAKPARKKAVSNSKKKTASSSTTRKKTTAKKKAKKTFKKK